MPGTADGRKKARCSRRDGIWRDDCALRGGYAIGDRDDIAASGRIARTPAVRWWQRNLAGMQRRSLESTELVGHEDFLTNRDGRARFLTDAVRRACSRAHIRDKSAKERNRNVKETQELSPDLTPPEIAARGMSDYSMARLKSPRGLHHRGLVGVCLGNSRFELHHSRSPVFPRGRLGDPVRAQCAKPTSGICRHRIARSPVLEQQ